MPDKRLSLQAVAGLEDPPDAAEAGDEEERRHAKAHADVDVGDLEEAPAKAADQVDDGIEERDGLPGGRQDVDRVERAAEERERRDDEHRDELQLLEAARPDADDETEQAESHRGEDEEGQ